MRLLLDTHALLWFLLDDEQLSETAKALIADDSNAPALDAYTVHGCGKRA